MQKFLVWIEQKSCDTKSNYKPATVRTYFFNCVCKIERASKLARTRDDTVDSTFTVAQVLDRNRIRSKDDLIKALANTDDFVNKIVEALKFADLSIILPDAFETIELHDMLQEVKNQFPDTHLKNNIDLYNWWKVNGRTWTENLKYILNQDRNIGHDWQFSESQKKLLQQYYDANKLLVDCLNSDCYVSREVREEIESTLLLPIASIHKRKSS